MRIHDADQISFAFQEHALNLPVRLIPQRVACIIDTRCRKKIKNEKHEMRSEALHILIDAVQRDELLLSAECLPLWKEMLADALGAPDMMAADVKVHFSGMALPLPCKCSNVPSVPQSSVKRRFDWEQRTL